MESPPKISHESFIFRFPARLWRIINSCSSGAISWGPSGKTIRILRKKFEEEYLTGNAKPFKTTKYESFVRQLNHYGFKKVKKRSVMKKVTKRYKRTALAFRLVTIPVSNGETKEETALLSEYYNPNFTRGQPERVTFLERRSQLHDNSGQRKRSKRGSASANAQNEISKEATSAAKKIKKETSVQVSKGLLPSGAENGHSSSDNDNKNTKCADLRGKVEKGRAVPSQTAASSAKLPAQTRHDGPVYQHLSSHKQTTSGGKSLRAEERTLYQRRPYYYHDGLDPRYLRPSLAPPFTRHMASAWHQPYHPCDPTQMYDHYFGLYGSREDHLYPPSFPPDLRHMVRVRAPQADHNPPVHYHDNRYFVHGPSDPWDVVYRMNRRHGMPIAGGSSDNYKGHAMTGKHLRWPQKHFPGSYEHDLASPNGRSTMVHEPYPLWPHPPFGSPDTRAMVRWRAPDFAADTHSTRATNNEFRSLVVCKGQNTTHVPHNTLDQSVIRDISNDTYRQTGALTEPTETWPQGERKTEDSSTQEAIQRNTTDISSNTSLNDVNYQEPNGELAIDGSKNEDEVQKCSENLQIITDEAVDLPLDVAEETVVTCNTAGTAVPDHCLPVEHQSSPEDKMLMDTLMNASTSLSSDDTPEPYHLPTEKVASSSRHLYGQGVDMYGDYHSDAMDSQSFSRHYPDNFHSRQDQSPKPFSPVCAWGYPHPRQLGIPHGHCSVPNMSPQSWSHPISQLDERMSSSQTSTTNRLLPLSFSANGTADTEDSSFQRNTVSPLNDPTSNGVDCFKTASQAQGGNPRAKVLVEREERGDLTQLSSSSVQELLSAALRTPGMKIMVDDHNHPEKMVLVIPKSKRRELSGCM